VEPLDDPGDGAAAPGSGFSKAGSSSWA
jgi:hypothetical protein